MSVKSYIHTYLLKNAHACFVFMFYTVDDL